MILRRLLGTRRHLNRFPEILRCRQHTDQWLRLTAAYVGLKLNLPFKINIPTGSFEFLEPSDIATFWQIFYRRIYPVEFTDRLIVDAGANIGAFTLYALGAAPKANLIAIEPAPDTCVRMRSMLCANGAECRYTLHEAALGEIAGETTIQLDVESQFRRTGVSGQLVKMLTLDSVIPPGALVDLLKVDIEGAEYSVLNSVSPDTLRRIRRIVLEFHPQSPAKTALDPLVDGRRIAWMLTAEKLLVELLEKGHQQCP